MALVAALESVSLVTWFDETTPLRLIELTRPDVLVKGGDWPLDQIIGSEQVRSWGGQVRAIPVIHQRSTSAIVARIRGHQDE
jgi:bifunctional ADP-heptose synthase (sugar kinase/adenylyltransferase)